MGKRVENLSQGCDEAVRGGHSGLHCTSLMQEAHSPQTFVEELVPALRRAAELAHSLDGRVANIPKPGETSLAKAALTRADTEVQEILLLALKCRFSHVLLEAEEDTPSLCDFSGQGPGVVVIDPIDGTLHSFLEGRGPYGVMVGLALAGRYEAGLVALPREELFFDAVRGRGARRALAGANSVPIRLGDGTESSRRRVLLSYDMPAQVGARLREQGYEVGYGCGGALSVAPLMPDVCGSIRWCPGRGISVRGRIGALIAAEAGALVRTAGGAAFPERLEQKAEVLFTARDKQDLSQLMDAFALAS